MIKKKCNLNSITTITLNKRARYEYFINEEIETGLILMGWEVKALRSGKVNISGSYILLKNKEAYLFGTIITPLNITSSHVKCDPMRIRKLLLNQYELNSLFGKISREKYTIIALSLYWKNSWCKLKIGIAKGKKEYNRRLDIKKREWILEKARIIKNFNK